MKQVNEVSLGPRARITGAVYLFYFLTAISSALFIGGLVVSGDAVATANNILAHESLYRFGLAVEFISLACYIAVTALFYNLFRPVNRNLSLIAAFFSLVGCAVQTFGSLFQLAPLVVLKDNHYLSVFKVEQLQALSMLFLEFNTKTGNIAIVFFGFYCLLIGYLIFWSTFLPRILGVLLLSAGLAWLTFLSPSLANNLSPYVEILGILAEGLLMLWLLIMGVNVQRWNEQARAIRIKSEEE